MAERYKLTIRGIEAAAEVDGSLSRIRIGDSELRLEAPLIDMIMLLHSLCHVVMDDEAREPVDAHSSCHERP